MGCSVPLWVSCKCCGVDWTVVPTKDRLIRLSLHFAKITDKMTKKKIKFCVIIGFVLHIKIDKQSDWECIACPISFVWISGFWQHIWIGCEYDYWLFNWTYWFDRAQIYCTHLVDEVGNKWQPHVIFLCAYNNSIYGGNKWNFIVIYWLFMVCIYLHLRFNNYKIDWIGRKDATRPLNWTKWLRARK